MGHVNLKFKAEPPSATRPKIAADAIQSGADTSASNAYRKFTLGYY